MRPGQELTEGLVEVDDKGVDGAANGLAAPGRRGSRTDCGSCRPGSPAPTRCRCSPARPWWSRADPGGAAVVSRATALADLLWAIPMVGAAVVIAAARLAARTSRSASALAGLAGGAGRRRRARGRFRPGGEQYQFVETHPWIPSFGTGYILGLDGIALALVVLTAVLVPLLMIAGWNDADDQAGLARPLDRTPTSR